MCSAAEACRTAGRRPRAWLFVLWLLCLPAVAGTPSGGVPGPGCEPGSDYLYALRLQERTVGSLAGLGAEGRADSPQSSLLLEGRLRLRCYGRLPGGEAWRMGLALERVERFEMTFQGSELGTGQPLAETLASARELLLDYGPDGRLLRVRHKLQQDPLWVRLGAVMASELQQVLPAQAEHGWSAMEIDSGGRVRANYRRKDPEGGLQRLEKIKDEYDHAQPWKDRLLRPSRVRGVYRLSLDGQGLLQRLDGDKRASADSPEGPLYEVHTTLAAALESVRANTGGPPPADNGLLDYDFSGRDSDARLQRRLLRQSAEGMQFQTYAAWLRGRKPAGARAGRETVQMQWRMAALLGAQPQLTPRLEALFLELPAGGRGRHLVLSVLVSAGHAEAQAGLLRLMQDPAVRADADYFRLLQLPAFLSDPAEPLVDFYLQRLDDPDPDVSTAAHYVAGALAGALWKGGRQARARALNQALAADLAAADSPRARHTGLFALRNTRIADNVTVVRPYLSDGTALVRRAALRALGTLAGRPAVDLLLGGLGDPEGAVRNGALESLQEQALNGADLAAIRRRVEDASLDVSSDSLLFTLQLKYADRYPEEVRATLEAMLVRGVATAEMGGRVRRLLGELDRRLAISSGNAP